MDGTYIGIDMGGTKSDILIDSAMGCRAVNGPGMNVSERGAEGAADLLFGLLAGQLATPRTTRICVGAAGAGSARNAAELRKSLSHRTAVKEEHILVISDAMIALAGAFRGHSGIVVLAGTGSGCFALDESGGFHRMGGWGRRIGDPGSGESIGRRSVEHMLETLGAGHMDALTRNLLDTVNRNAPSMETDDVAEVLRIVNQEETRFSEFAPVVIQAAADGDKVALDLLETEVAKLSQQYARLMQCPAAIQRRIALIGGLTTEPAYRSALRCSLRSAAGEVVFVEPEMGPAEGAVLLARSMDEI